MGAFANIAGTASAFGCRSERQSIAELLRARRCCCPTEVSSCAPTLCERARVRQAGEEAEGGALCRQPASGAGVRAAPRIVILGAYVFNNVLLMLTGGIGEPYDYKTGRAAGGRIIATRSAATPLTVFFGTRRSTRSCVGRERHLISTTSNGIISTTRLGFFAAPLDPRRKRRTAADPDAARASPGTPRWRAATGAGDRQVVPPRLQRSARRAATWAHRENFLDLDPTYKDALGRPLNPHELHSRDND